MIEENGTATGHRCGQPRAEHPEWYCLTCGCWGDMHPNAGIVVGGPNCVCNNFHAQGSLSQDEQREQAHKEEGHYIRKVDTSGHYCHTPQTSYSWRGEVWQCDVCHQKWKFKSGPLERLSVVHGHWKKIR